MFFIRIKDDETESTETSVLKSHLVHEVPVLASPDLLSDVSEMKQDLMKMTALLTTDVSSRAGPLGVKELARAAEEEPGEPFEIVERVKEDLEKVNEILRGGTCPEGPGPGPRAQLQGEPADEEWVVVSAEEIEEAKQRAPLEVTEVPCVEVRLEKEARAQGQKDAAGLVSYLTEDLNSYTTAPQEDRRPGPCAARDRRPGSHGRDSPPDETQRTQKPPKPGLGAKKPVRRKLKEKQKQKEGSAPAGTGKSEPKKGSSEESLDEDTELAPEPLPTGKATSPLVEETPIGSIKDKVKALQKRVEDEQKGRSKLPVRVKGKEDVPRKVSPRPPPAASPPLKSDRRPPASPSSKADRHASLASSAKSDRHPPASSPSKTERHSPVSPSTKTERHSPVSPSTKTERHSPVSPATKTERHSPVSPSTKTERHSPVSPSGKADRRPPVSPGRTDRRLPVSSAAARTEKHPPAPASGKTEKRLSVSPSGKAEKAAPVSPTSKTERIEETMSVRELMQAFQSGQDPSKHKAGLFEHKAAKPKQLQERGKVRAEKEKGQTPAQKEAQKTESPSVRRGQRLPGAAAPEPRRGSLGALGRREDTPGAKEAVPNHRTPPVGGAPGEELDELERGDRDLQISPDRKTSTDFSEVIKQELEDNDQYQRFRHREELVQVQVVPEQVLTSPFHRAFPPEPGSGELLPALASPLGGSRESLRQEGAAGSPCGSLMEGTPQGSSEESYKHEGLAETPETSPESLSFSPKKSQEHIGDTPETPPLETDVPPGKDRPSTTDPPQGAEEPGTAVPGGSGPGAGGVQEATPDPSRETGPRPEGLGSCAVPSAKEAPAERSGDLPCRESPGAGPGAQGLTSPPPSLPPQGPARTGPSQAAPRSPPGLELPLSRPDSAEVLSPGADESLAVSHADSLEASPVLEDNSSHKTPDSLEPSPLRESPCRDSLEGSPVEPKMKPGFLPSQVPLPAAAPRAELLAEAGPVRSRLLRDPDGSAEDDSLEQTSLVESSGKSPLSPDTPSSEEVSYEVTPKAADAGTPKPAVIQECAEEDDSGGGEKKSFTPEEEMFKMVTKVKTFDELEQEAKQKRDYRKEPKPEGASSSSEPDAEGSADLGGPPRAEGGSDVPMLVAADSRKASSSSDSEPELGQLRADAAPGLLPEPVIHVQPPSPLPSSLDSSSSPEEAPFQPIAPKQYTFRMDAQDVAGQSGGGRECDSQSPEDSPAGPPGADAAPDDVNGDGDPPKVCAGRGCEAGSPGGSATPVSSGPRGPPSAVSQEPVVRQDPGEDPEGEDPRVSPAASPQVGGPRKAPSPPSPRPDCPASEGHGSGDDAVSPSSTTKPEVTKTDHASESFPEDCPRLDPSTPAHTDRPSVDAPGSAPAETEEACDHQVISPYENVPPHSFFSSEESKTPTGERHTGLPSPVVGPEPGLSPQDGGVVGCSPAGRAPSEESCFEGQSVDVEATREGTLWETRPDSAPAREPSLPGSSAAVGQHASTVLITTTAVDSDAWSEVREDDEAFEARVREEEQKVFGLMADRQSQGATPDTTPARTPTEEGTPTSEQNPFLFQEGKLFEMTRSGAIDMTKRSYADESFHFFQIGQESGEETISEDVTGGAAAEVSPPETPARPAALSESKDTEEADLLPDDPSEDGEGTPASDGHFPSQTGPPASRDTSGADAASVGARDLHSLQGGREPPPSSVRQPAGPTCPDSALQAQLDFSTVTGSVYSDRDDESPDSSPEEQKSVIEIPTAPTESLPAPESASQVPVRTGPPTEEEGAPPGGLLPSPYEDRTEQETKPRSRIPVKAPPQGAGLQPSPPDPSLQRTGAPRAPDVAGAAADHRSKCESEASPVDSKAPCPGRTPGCPQTEAEGGEGAEEPTPQSEDAATRPKVFASRLPVKSRGASSSCRGAPSPSREGKEHFLDLYRNSIEFFEEISDEASKLVDRLTQADREQEAVSDDESSSALEVSVVEHLPPVGAEHSGPEDIFDTRPIWDESIETLIERIPDENGHDRAAGQQDEQERMEERLACIADHLGFSWTELARELDFTEEQIHQIRVENPNSLQDQSHALLKYWLERDGKHATDTSLIECLTKINRMDIVHLMETSAEPLPEHPSHSYAEMEQTIALDHSEGFSALPDELSPRQLRIQEQAVSRGSESCSRPPVVSDEDLSVGGSTFQDGVPSTDGAGPAAELSFQAHQEQERQGLSGTVRVPEEPAPGPQQESFEETPRTEGPDAGKAWAARGSPSRTPEDGRLCVQAPPPPEQADAPLVQEPEEPPELRDGGSPRKNSLVIVESADEDAAFQKELAAELGELEASSDEEATVTTRVVRRRVVIQGDDVPDMPPETVTEEKYVDEHGHTVVKKVTRKVIRRYVSSDGIEREEITVQGQPQDPVSIEDGDGYSKVIKRVVLKSDTEQSEVTVSEPGAPCEASQFQAEPVEGRRVSKVIKTTVVRGERLEKHLGDPRLASDLPSAKEDFEQDDAQ